MPVQVDEAVDAIKASSNSNSQLEVNAEDSADGLGIDVINWPTLCLALEVLSTQNWFPESGWLNLLIEEHRHDSRLKLSHDRYGQFQNMIDEANARLPVVLEAWESMVHPRGKDAFHVSLEAREVSAFAQLTEELSEAFRFLAVDNSFSVVVSEGFILVVPEGPYSHFCASFALYLAKKSQAIFEGEDYKKIQGVIKYLPSVEEESFNEASIEDAMSKWVSDMLQEDWEWFEEVRKEHFPQSGGARNNIEKAIPVLRELLKDGRCEIDPPKEAFAENIPEGFSGKIHQLQGKITGLTASLSAAERLQRTALNAIESVKDFV